MQDVGILQILYSRAVLQRTSVALPHIFGDRFAGKDCGLCLYNPSAREVGGLGVLYEAAQNKYIKVVCNEKEGVPRRWQMFVVGVGPWR